MRRNGQEVGTEQLSQPKVSPVTARAWQDDCALQSPASGSLAMCLPLGRTRGRIWGGKNAMALEKCCSQEPHPAHFLLKWKAVFSRPLVSEAKWRTSHSSQGIPLHFSSDFNKNLDDNSMQSSASNSESERPDTTPKGLRQSYKTIGLVEMSCWFQYFSLLYPWQAHLSSPKLKFLWWQIYLATSRNSHSSTRRSTVEKWCSKTTTFHGGYITLTGGLAPLVGPLPTPIPSLATLGRPPISCELSFIFFFLLFLSNNITGLIT